MITRHNQGAAPPPGSRTVTKVMASSSDHIVVNIGEEGELDFNLGDTRVMKRTSSISSVVSVPCGVSRQKKLPPHGVGVLQSGVLNKEGQLPTNLLFEGLAKTKESPLQRKLMTSLEEILQKRAERKRSACLRKDQEIGMVRAGSSDE